ncbi:MAG: DNA mismatch repair endonuclease MutL [Lachnospiraceae bacterium]|nr:DNA mismatch repair endonuclease MutL [Lachnospiraceae bacterium]
MIKVLSKETIDKIAAGEVIERPSSVVKELVENSVDAGANIITVEIKNGGTDLIRVTDNGHGINCEEVRTAFLRHATGKISDAEDLMAIHTLGFRGEALSSIAAVTRTEIITKTQDQLTAVRYRIEGGEELSYEEIGAPDGTTIVARDLFYNVPARKKFLKTAITEASHITDLIEKFALSHPFISFRYINNGQTKLYTSGNGEIKDIIYQIYGRDITNSLIDTEYCSDNISVKGLIGKPEVSRPNRNFENYFVNGRYIKSTVIAKAIEDAYEERLMQHQFPFSVLIIDISPDAMDVNVHPTKMDVRFSAPFEVYDEVSKAVKSALNEHILIPYASPDPEEKVISGIDTETEKNTLKLNSRPAEAFETKREMPLPVKPDWTESENKAAPSQLSFDKSDFAASQKPFYRLIGQVFSTYWIIEYDSRMLIMDQHAAHEKIYYERLIKQYRKANVSSQMINPPCIITLSDTEAAALYENINDFSSVGYEIEHFGGNEYAVRAVPDNLPSINKAELLKEMISGYAEEVGHKDALLILEKTASMACKAAVKGGQRLSFAEADILVKELLECDNPYCCPHGRPTMIEFSLADLEKKFKRIV